MKSDVGNPKHEPQSRPSRLEILLRVIAGIIIISVFSKGVIDVDGTFDTWGYHLPQDFGT